MKRYGEPRHSCPKIDSVFDSVNTSIKHLTVALSECTYVLDHLDTSNVPDGVVHSLEQTAKYISLASDWLESPCVERDLEATRSINEELRSWGSSLDEELIEVRGELSCVQDDLDDVRRQLEDALERIKELESLTDSRSG